MAKRKYSKSSKIQPAVQTMTFVFSVEGAGKERRFIDLSQCASLLNRRFYRQGINWAVSGIKLLSTAGVTGQISIAKLPNTWVMSNAWEKTFRAWQRMIKNATDEAGNTSIKGKFLDFKIFADSDHHAAGFAANLLPHSSATTLLPIQTATAGQWQASDITIPTQGTGAAVDYELIAVGPNDPGVGASGKDAKSIIQGYADSRALPYEQDPNVPADANTNWIIGMFDDGTAQDPAVINMLETTGDEAPYPYEGDGTNPDTMYPGGETNMQTLEIHDQEFVTGTTVGGTTRLKGGNFPCGLISVDTFGFARDDAFVLQVSLVPGMHRGYLCEPMTEM